MAAHLKHALSGHRVCIVNTHLTVAHAENSWDIPSCRPLQMDQVLTAARESKSDVTIISGDLNCDHLESEPPESPYNYTVADVSKPVHMAFQSGFQSALHESLPDGVRPISHTCSYAQDGAADYVLYKSNQVRLIKATLHPEGLKPDAQWDAANGWYDGTHDFGAASKLSDHRPLVVDFGLPSPQ